LTPGPSHRRKGGVDGEISWRRKEETNEVHTEEDKESGRLEEEGECAKSVENARSWEEPMTRET